MEDSATNVLQQGRAAVRTRSIKRRDDDTEDELTVSSRGKVSIMATLVHSMP
jgi:hypothetical protein